MSSEIEIMGLLWVMGNSSSRLAYLVISPLLHSQIGLTYKKSRMIKLVANGHTLNTPLHRLKLYSRKRKSPFSKLFQVTNSQTTHKPD